MPRGKLQIDNGATAPGWGLTFSRARSGVGAITLNGGSTAVAGHNVAMAPVAIGTKRWGISWLHVLSLGAGALVVFGFIHPVAYNLPTLRSAAETVMTLLALTAAWLVGLQFRQTQRLRDLLAVGGLITLALIEFFGNALPAVLHLHSASGFNALLPVGGLMVAATFAATALAPSGAVMARRRHPLTVTVATSVVAASIAGLIGVLLGHSEGASYSGRAIGRVLQQPLESIVLLGTVSLFLYAAYVLICEGQRNTDPSRLMFAGSAILFASARLDDLTMSSMASGLMTPRDCLRVLAFALLLAGILRKGADIRALQARAAALAERRRVAADLHDGLAQDLALIAAHGGRMDAEWGGDHPVTVAAKRALAVSRDAITVLSDVGSSPPQDAFEMIAADLRHRFGIDVTVDVDPQINLMPEVQEHVVRITREAISNAARHGNAQSVVVCLSRAPAGNVLRVSDNGTGINSTARAGTGLGFGLHNMHERTSALAGNLTIRRRKIGGTELTLAFP